LRYVGRRPDDWGVNQPSALIGDLTLSTRWHDWSALASVRNIGDASYDHVSNSFDQGRTYPEDGRNFWLQLQYDFR
jgi:outer membrane receptor protein involved in Fe transport